MVVVRLIGVALLLLAFGYFFMYSQKFVNFFLLNRDKFSNGIIKTVGKRVKKINIKVQRRANLNKGSLFYKIYTYYDDILVSLDMRAEGVTVTGLMVFMITIALAGTIFISLVLKVGTVFVWLGIAIALFYLETTIFKLASVSKYEQREANVMDAIDLLVSDIKSGVYNAIVRYKDSFHPDVQPFFLEFIDDVQNKGYGFKQAMLLLNDKLGMTFSEFAQKAILYEEKADKNMDDIFSSIIEMNRQRRTLRYINNVEFANLRMQFIISFVAIVGYAIMSMMMDSWIRSFFASQWGAILIIVDLFIVTTVLNTMAVIKAKSL